ncbi:MAG: sugar phosphate isomerase/epimerase, partial [Actinobacteria bacterium]|nr:sugar phosphate isomerase/epimerase [Actinomycetota bacterium]
LAAAAGAEVVSLVHGQPDRPNHFTKDPPLAQQLDRMVRNLRTLAPIAEGMGLVLATEGHMDYRCAEYAQVLEGVNSPWVRHVFDFADSIAVNEDPLEAVQRVAKYTVASHLKDMRVQPITEIATGAFFHTPIGQGSVPVERMLEILAAQAPNPGGLHHYLEVTPPPEIDVERWLGASVEWLRTHCARFWSRGGQSNAPTKQGSAP